ncbi:hypothetical protein TrLO_g9064 [Triparma laevis f. longispina]|uniref:Mitochondrial import inner membrane translocase subunit TIM22 n=1 Tax=Triparma laevis f. longispina TaxID=1714387 RepID=A0A9W7KZU1_9STRA|nr:hypothetical protein TrLO_g9064 [Triparma laevis f. longispina]
MPNDSSSDLNSTTPANAESIYVKYASPSSKLPPDPYAPSPRDPLHAPPPNYDRNEASARTAIKTSSSPTPMPLPFILPWSPTNPPAGGLPPDFGWISTHCGGRAAMGLVGGGVMGLGMGVFLGAMSDMTPPVTVYKGKEVPQAPIKEQARAVLRQTGEKSLYWCRNFAFITGVFSGSECIVEKIRGRNDVWNSTISGCVTGAAIQAKQGPQAACFGCIGFAAFSIIIDKVMGH